jgi:hypothetical protein
MYNEGRLAEAQAPVNKEQDTTADEVEGGSPVRFPVKEPAICDEGEWRRF